MSLKLKQKQVIRIFIETVMFSGIYIPKDIMKKETL